LKKNSVTELEDRLKKLDDISYDSIDRLMRNIMKKYDVTAKELHNNFVSKHNKTPDTWIKDLKEGTLHHWFKGSRSKDGKPGWVQADGSPCANEPGETKTPKCFSSGRLSALKRKGEKGDALIRSAVRRKRQKDKNQQSKSSGEKPTMVPTFAKGKKDPNYIKAEPGIKEAMELNEAKKDTPGKGSGKKDACYHKVKSRYDVWPSAYASGALVKCRKVGAKNWGTQSESMEMVRYCPKCAKDEKRSECKYGPKYWDMFSLPSKLSGVAMSNPHYHANSPHPGNFTESNDHEYSMARSELSTIISAAKRLRNKMKGEGNIEAWVQSKITKAADYLDSAADYIDSGEHKVEEEVSFTVGGKKLTSAQEKLHKMSPSQRSQLPSQMVKKLVGVDLPPVKSSPSSMVRTADSYEPCGKTFMEFMESIDKSKMKCNSPKSDPVGDSLTGKSHVVKACENGKEKIIRFGQRGVKGSPKKEGESKEYASRRERFKARHAKNISKGKMSAAYWSNRVKW
jgi:head-tail adaptor